MLVLSTSPQRMIKSPVAGLCFGPALAGIRRLVVQIKAIGKDDLSPPLRAGGYASRCATFGRCALPSSTASPTSRRAPLSRYQTVFLNRLDLHHKPLDSDERLCTSRTWKRRFDPCPGKGDLIPIHRVTDLPPGATVTVPPALGGGSNSLLEHFRFTLTETPKRVSTA